MRVWPSARVRHALRRDAVSTRTRVILQNDRRSGEEASVDGGDVLLVPGGAQCRPGEYLHGGNPRNSDVRRFKRASERAGSRAFVCGCVVVLRRTVPRETESNIA